MSALLLMFDLDRDDDRGWDARLDGSIERVGSLPYFETHTVTLEPGELFEIRVHATVSQSLVEWELAVDVETAAGKRRTIVVRSPGNGPFRTSGCSRDRFEDRWYCGVAAAPGEGFRRADPTVGE
jgi:hypothetical protein